jgi:multiple sugar transport system substrate-binding protein
MRTRTFPAAVAAFALALSGCAGVGAGHANSAASTGPTPQGALNIMGFGGDDEVAGARIGLFNKTYPQVSVTHNKGDFDAQQFLTAVASGNPPDLVYMDRNLIGTYAAKGVLTPLKDCISTQKIDMSSYRQAAVRSVTLKGDVYGIPEFYVVTTNLVDGRVLAQAGVPLWDIQTKDWPALKATSAKLAKVQGSTVQRIGFDPKLPEMFPLWAQANGATLVNDNGSPNLATPQAVQALTFSSSLINDQGGWSSFQAFRGSYDIFGAKNPLTVDAVSVTPMENWYVNVLTSYAGKGLQLQSTPFTDTSGKPISMVGGSAWAIPKGAKNATAACAWAKTMTSTDAWMAAADARKQKVDSKNTFFTGLFTANKAADEQIKAKYLTKVSDPGFQQAIDNYYAVLDTGVALNPSPAGAEIDAAWKSAVTRVLEGQQTPQQALDQAQKEAQTAYDKVKGNG